MRKELIAIFAAMLTAACLAGNTWKLDVEANSDRIPDFTREFGSGETWTISPLVTDDGVPRVWPTNATFIFFWQRQNMGTNWWASTNIVYPVYHDVSVATTTAVITTWVTNLAVITYPTTNNVGVTNYFAYTNTSTSYTFGYTVTNVIDVGRVNAIWNGATMDCGSQGYNWFLGEYEGSANAACYRVNGSITVRRSPGATFTFNGSPLFWPWVTTNALAASNYVSSTMCSNIAKAVCANPTNLPATLIYAYPSGLGGYYFREGP